MKHFHSLQDTVHIFLLYIPTGYKNAHMEGTHSKCCSEFCAADVLYYISHNQMKLFDASFFFFVLLSHPSPTPCFLQTPDGGQSKGDTKLQRKTQWLLDEQGSWNSSDWLMESARLGKCLHGHRAAVFVNVYILWSQALWWEEEEKENSTWSKREGKGGWSFLVMQTGHSWIFAVKKPIFFYPLWLALKKL